MPLNESATFLLLDRLAFDAICSVNETTEEANEDLLGLRRDERAYITQPSAVEDTGKPCFGSKHVAAKVSRIQMQMAFPHPGKPHICLACDSMIHVNYN